MGDVMIPPWIRPESPETVRWIDDATITFPPAFGRGTTQRGIWADPRWGLRRRYRGLRSDERAAILNALSETRGQLNIIRVTPHAPLRGSFATSELLTNNTFASGTTGWTTGTEYSLSVSDRVMRATRTSVTVISDPLYQSVSLTQYVPYVARAIILAGRGSFTALGPEFASFESSTGAPGYRSVVRVPQSTGAHNVGIYDGQNTGLLAGDYFQVPWMSLARCALVDNAANSLLRSDELDNSGVWTRTGLVALGTNTANAPDGTASADIMQENSSAGTHGIDQQIARFPMARDLCSFGYFIRVGGARNIALTAGNDAIDYGQAFFDLGTGALGATVANGAATNVRSFIAPAGNGWYFCCVIARAPSAATLRMFAQMANGTTAGSTSYTGGGTASVAGWRVGCAVSSVPTRGGQTTSSALDLGTTQSGAGLYTKGWPASTTGLLLAGDWFEINGELKQLTAPVNSNAAGLAYMQFRPGLAGAPADNDPIIVYEPFGRFIYSQGTREFSNLFGIYGDCEMDLEEVYV